MKIFSMKKSLRARRGATDGKSIGSVWQQIRTEAAASVRNHHLSPFRRRGHQGAPHHRVHPAALSADRTGQGLFQVPAGYLLNSSQFHIARVVMTEIEPKNN
ncbi:MAG: hypothetical protein J1E06_04110 [Acutalibacter sp.]|nr:hypothetical protein [Acutalibacter sp.]